MTKSKLLIRLFLYLLIFVPLTYFGFLNQSYFLEPASLHLSLTQPAAIAFNYDTPAVSNAVYWIACLLTGMVLAVVFALPTRLRSRKEIKALNNMQGSLQEEVASLKQSVRDLTPIAEAIKEPEPSQKAA